MNLTLNAGASLGVNDASGVQVNSSAHLGQGVIFLSGVAAYTQTNGSLILSNTSSIVASDNATLALYLNLEITYILESKRLNSLFLPMPLCFPTVFVPHLVINLLTNLVFALISQVVRANSGPFGLAQVGEPR